MRRFQWFLVMAVISSVVIPNAAADTLHVPAQYPTLQAAVDAAVTGDVVVVANGTWTGPGNKDVRLVGVDIAIRSADGPKSCILDCESTPEIPFRGFLIESGETRATVIQGFTIRRGSTLSGAVSDPFNGGGIRILGSSPTIRDCVFEDNLAGCWGGALYAGHGGTPLITNCTFRHNYSNDDGGAIFSWNGAQPEVRDCLFVDNDARVTGGAITAFDTIFVRHVTIVGSDAPFGAAIYAFGGEISNSILWGNGLGPIDGSTSVRYSIVEGGQAGVGNLDVDPLFALDGYHLRQQSPAIGAGDPAFVPVLGEVDIDGQPRFIGPRVDMGADESSFPRRHRLPQ